MFTSYHMLYLYPLPHPLFLFWVSFEACIGWNVVEITVGNYSGAIDVRWLCSRCDLPILLTWSYIVSNLLLRQWCLWIFQENKKHQETIHIMLRRTVPISKSFYARKIYLDLNSLQISDGNYIQSIGKDTTEMLGSFYHYQILYVD